MEWKVVFFESGRGEKPVEKFIKEQQSQAQAKIAHAIDLLKQYGSMVRMPHSKSLGVSLYELRIRGKEEIRILYVFKHRDIYLLHAFKKQTQKTPHKELEIALKRLKALT